MSEVKCQVFQSGTNSWHVWEVGAKEGDPCQCGQLPYTECHVPKEPGKYDGTTMREVMEWASENVVVVVAVPESGWVASVKWDSWTGDTLYDALYLAWKERKP